MSVLVIAIVIGIAFWASRRTKVAPIEAPSYEGDVKLMVFPHPAGEQIFPLEGGIPLYSTGDAFHHLETGQKVEIIKLPDGGIIDGEYTIRWPSGSTGQIHQASLKEFFE